MASMNSSLEDAITGHGDLMKELVRVLAAPMPFSLHLYCFHRLLCGMTATGFQPLAHWFPAVLQGELQKRYAAFPAGSDTKAAALLFSGHEVWP